MKYFTVLVLLVSLQFGMAQEKKTLTLEDATLGYWKGLYPENLSGLRWVEDDNSYAYNDEDAIVFFDPVSLKEQRRIRLADLQKVYPQLKRLPPMKNLNKDGLTFQDRNNYQFYNQSTGEKQVISINEKAENADFSKDAKAVAYTLDNNLYVHKLNGAEVAVTKNENKNIVSGQAIHRSEYGITKGTFWSPKGNLLAFYQKDERDVKEYPLVDETTYPATAIPIKYPMAGLGSEYGAVGIYDVAKNKSILLNIDTSDNHYLTNLTWTPDEKYVMLAEINRATTHYDLNLYDVKTGNKVRTIMSETNPIWVEPEHDAVFLPNSNTEFIWFSEKDGFMNLYLYDTSGKFKKQLTNFKWVVHEVLGFDKNNKHVFISGTGKDARETHTFKVNLRNGRFTQLTSQPGTHQSQLSPDGNYLIDRYSSINVPGETQIIDTKTGKFKTIQTSKNPLADYNVGKQEFVDIKAADGTNLHGIIMKPANFDPNKKYPVLVYVYGGPHAQLVTNSYLGGASMWLPAFASLNDYIVFTLDNRGSAHRGFAFESGIHRRLGDLEIEDQLKGVEFLKSLPYVDADRMVVNGWSFGGFMTSSLMLRHPDVFKVGVAGGPVIDWKYYEVMYGERYMDTPQENPEGYEKSKVSNYIQNLKGKLLLITGSVDPVVVPQHSMSLLKAAVDNKVQVDFFSYPTHEHNVRGMDRVHLIEKMANYIVEHNK
ncbi:S9 family peptidase [Weeksellaceae bacterium KMM 9713]|uniref:S9 family peptidase n=1 Tax=Profundicola chukchiensis TaxID=2961959 RepID=A0A9X4RWJ9_9FLAO|nr:DPP IV N-terminal domain-containing protein [Profundicola chukchiensis]MDG4945882.1 S9 family peptidase [Profundicola chukchiensis]